MDISTPSKQAVDFMLESIKNKLRVANNAAINPDHYTVEHYEDLRFIYDLVSNKNQFSISEVEAIVAELGNMKK